MHQPGTAPRIEFGCHQTGKLLSLPLAALTLFFAGYFKQRPLLLSTLVQAYFISCVTPGVIYFAVGLSPDVPLQSIVPYAVTWQV